MSVQRGVLTVEQRAELTDLAGSRWMDGRVTTRARMVLWWDQGLSAVQIASLVGTSDKTARAWPARYADHGVAGLEDVAHPGKPKQIPAVVRSRVLALSRMSPPAELGVSHWSSRLLAMFLAKNEGVRVSHTWIADLWAEVGLRPWQQGTFKLSKDPAFAEKVADVVGLYLDPPAGAVVLSVDEKSQIQALERTRPVLPMTFDKSEKRTADYVRHGTTTLFGALDVGSGEVVGRCYPRHTSDDFLDFMDRVMEVHDAADVHVVLDNFATHKTAKVAAWLEAHPRVAFHFTPTSASWLNQIEIWFGIITKQSIRRGTFTSVKQLIGRIEAYITSWNERARPFVWVSDAETILAKVRWVETEIKHLTGHWRQGRHPSHKRERCPRGCARYQ